MGLLLEGLSAVFDGLVVQLDESPGAAAATCRVGAANKRALPHAIASYTREVNAYDGPQCNADAILTHLAPSHPDAGPPPYQPLAPSTTLLLGVVDCDLYSRRADWNFLWGWAPHFGRKLAQPPQGRAPPHGVVSFARGGGTAAEAWARSPGLRHLLKHHVRTAATLGLEMRQCTLARCLFNGVGCDEEMAAVPWTPCPCCLRKLVVSGACTSVRVLFQRLANFFEKHNEAARRRQAELPFEDDLRVVRERLRAM